MEVVGALAAQLRGAFKRGGSGVAVAAMAAASVVVLALVLLLRALAARDQWAVGVEDATPAQVAWALLGVILCSYHLVRKEPQLAALPPVTDKRWSPLADMTTALSKSSRAASDLALELWTSLPSLPSLPTMDWVFPAFSMDRDYSAEDGDDASPSASESAVSLALVDELSTPMSRGPSAAINSDRPIPFENDLFKGSLLFLVNDQHTQTTSRWYQLFGDKKRLLWVQVQGQFKRAPPPGAVIYLAWELPVRSVDSYMGFWARKLVQVLMTIVQQFNPDAHISLGEGASDSGKYEGMEIPHTAFPLYQKVDELVISPAGVHDTARTSRLPMLGQETFGETETHAQCRAALPVGQEPYELYSTNKVYTFQFHSMFCDLAQWKLVNLPGLPDVPLQRICDVNPIRLSAYALVSDPSRPKTTQRHVDRAKEYLFCFSVRRHESARHLSPRVPRFVPQVAPITIPTLSLTRSNSATSASGSSSGSSDDGSAASSASYPRSGSSGVLSPAFSSYVRSEPHLRRALLLANETPLSPTIRQFAVASHALSALQFELSMWIERVDPVAGRRNVAYVFTVDESSPSSSISSPRPSKRVRRTVVRSASTVKNVLLTLLDRDDDDDSDEDAATSTDAIPRGSFRGLTIESREFLYDRIDDETARVAHALQEIASPPPSSSLARDRYSLSAMRATLFHCLTSPSSLPSVPSARDIGVKLPSQLSGQVVCEIGAYRVLTAQCMRQEWVALTRRHVHFFRSFSVRASKSVPLHQVLIVRAVDDVDVLRDHEEREVVHVAHSPLSPVRSESRWYCIEIHLVLEVVTLFVETSGERAAFVRALNQRLDELASNPKRQEMFCAPALPLDALSLSVCLNQRTVWRHCHASRRSNSIGSYTEARTTEKPASDLVKASLRAAMALFEVQDRQKWTPMAVVALLDAVEELNAVDLSNSMVHATHNQRLAFALHLYHTLLLHAALVFGGFPRSHQQWKKMQAVPSYLVGDPRFPDQQVRFTLRDIERELLRSPMPPASILLDGASSFLHLRPPFSLGVGTGVSHGAARLPCPGVASPTSRRVVTQTSSRIPEHLALDRPDFRACFLLQMNADPVSTRVICVYERADGEQVASPRRKDTLDEQFNRTCARFLATELRIDSATRTIHVPRVCDWYFQTLDEQRLARSSSDPTAGSSNGSSSVLAVSGSRAFYCLQRLMPFMDDVVLQRVQHLLMGAGDACTIDFSEFWTRQSATRMLSDAAAAVLTRSPSSGGLLGLEGDDLGEVGGRAEAISLANSNGFVRFLRSIF